ncbi:MAG TPA: hypothetical protein VMK16_08630 [Acidimicrobiales bacterium]|nr:hypothetical protein [Acidimicrobiales bacterium]
MNDFDDLDLLEHDFGPGLRTALHRVATQIRPEDMPELHSGEVLLGYVSSESRERPLPEEPRRVPRRGALLLGSVAVAAAVVAVALVAQPSHHPAPAVQAATTTSAPAPPTTTSAPTTFTIPPQQPPAAASTFLLDIPSGKWRPLPSALLRGVASPDGTRVVALSPCPCAQGNEMSIGNIDGSDLHTLLAPDGTTIADASWSPDGTKIVYQAELDSTELFIVDVETHFRVQLTHLGQDWRGHTWLQSPRFTADGQDVLFMLPRDTGSDDSDVWSVPVSGGDPTLVKEHAAFPAPLPDGKIAYVSSSGTGPLGGIWTASIGVAGSARRVFADAFPTSSSGLLASPDGTKLLYERQSVVVGGTVGGEGPFQIPGRITVIDVATGATEYTLPGTVHATWQDNDTLVVTLPAVGS